MQKRILIVEDDNDTLDMLEYLAIELDLEVITQSSLLPLSEIVEISPSIVLLDHWVKGKLGGELCKQIKADPSTGHIPVIMVSALNNITQIAKDSGADACLSKPFNIDDLQAMISRFM
jgi:two-component system phosphate regulon response regulator PhoB